MERIVNSEEMRACDKNTAEHFGVPSIVLMERAALSVVSSIPVRYTCGSRILIVCGNGNNGADGLAVARLLYQKGCEVTVVQLPDNGKRSEENILQRHILFQYGFQISEELPGPGGQTSYGCVIDAIFGVGLSRAPEGRYQEWIDAMDGMDGYKVAIDMPSGVSSDSGEVYEASFHADLTVSFAYKKAGQVLYPGRGNCGTVLVAQIGITDESWLGRQPSCYALERSDLSRLPKRPARSHKGTFGKLLVIAGSKGMAGAALFCAQAAYRIGCGLVKIFTPEDNREILHTTLPEAVLVTYGSGTEGQDPGQEFPEQMLKTAIEWADVIAIGPGIGTGSQAEEIIRTVLGYADVPMVIDADGLNLLAKDPGLLDQAGAGVVLTPHIGEMARLCRKQAADIRAGMLQEAREFAAAHHVTCVLKDAATVTAAPDGTAYLNTSGCNAMAKGGSGDVLTGIIAGLLAQGMPMESAAALGVYIHGLAGEAAASEKGDYSVLARDIAGAIGTVVKKEKKERDTAEEGQGVLYKI